MYVCIVLKSICSIKEQWWSLILSWPNKNQRMLLTAHEISNERLKATDDFMSIYINFMKLY